MFKSVSRHLNRRISRIKRTSDPSRAQRKFRPIFDTLEDRVMPTLGTPTWVEQGPSLTSGPVPGINFGNNHEIDHNTGAIQAIAAHPTNADIVFVATVGGGVWRTTNATNTNPTWTPLTDNQPFLGMGAIAFSPVDTDTLYAGTGRFSSSFQQGGPAVGVYKTTDGGNTWTNLGQNTFGGQGIHSIVPTSLSGGQVVLAATDSDPNGSDNFPRNSGKGLFRSTDGGVTWTRISGNGTSGLPDAGVRDLVADPGDANRFYAAISGTGVFRSTNGGVNWTAVSNTQLTGVGNTVRIELAVHNSTNNNVLYAGLIGTNGQISGIFRSTDQGANWTKMDSVPKPPGPLHSARGQGNLHFSMVADPTNPNVVFLGGQSQDRYETCNTWSGVHVRGDASQPAGQQWSGLDGAAANNTCVHADSRVLVFDANGNILDGNDGGIYRLSSPNSAATRTWSSAIGNLRLTEFVSVAYDSVNNIVFGGTQDNGSPQQKVSGQFIYEDLSSGDGQIVQVDNTSIAGKSIHYSSSQGLGFFSRRTYNNTNKLEKTEGIALNVAGTTGGQGAGGLRKLKEVDRIPFTTVYELNNIDPTRMLLGTSFLYESTDRGDTLTAVRGLQNGKPANSLTGNVIEAIAYGGVLNGNANPDVAYVSAPVSATSGKIFLRTTAGGAFNELTNYNGSPVTDIVLDPDNWQRAYVTDNQGNVWRTTDAGNSWVNITNNLKGTLLTGGAETRVGSIEIFGRTTAPDDEVIFVGAQGGVFATDNPAAGAGATWVEFGTGMANVMVTDVRYDKTDNLLLAGTFGRGAWTVSNLSNFTDSQAPVIDLNGGAGGLDFAASFTQGGGAKSIVDANALTVTDADSANLSSATVTIAKLRDGAAEVLAATTTGTQITASYDANTGKLTLTGSDTLANYQQVLRTVTYNNTAAVPNPTARQVGFVLNDGTNNSTTATSTVTIQTVNRAPNLDLNGATAGIDFAATFTQGGGAVAIVDANNLTVADADSANLSSATVTITNLRNGTSEVLAATTTGTNINANYTAATGVLSLTGSDTVANYQQVLRTVTYNNSAAALDTTARAVRFVVNDGASNSAAATSTVTLVPVNTAPTLDLNGTTAGIDFAATFNQGGGAVAIVDANNLTVADADSANLASATITLTNRPDGNNESLLATTTGTNITAAAYDPNTGVLALSGTDTVANYQTVLRTVQYQNNAAGGNTTNRVVTFVVNDGAANSATATSTITIVAQPSAPALDLNGPTTGVNFAANFAQGSGPVLTVSPQATVTDNDSANLGGGTVTVTNIRDAGSEVLAANTTGTSITAAYDANTGVLTLSGSDTVANYQQVVRTVTYNNTALRPTAGPRTLNFAVNDGTQNSSVATSTITVIPLNAAPVVDLNGPAAGIDALRQLIEGSGPVTIAPEATIADADSTNLSSATLTIFGCAGDPECAMHEVLAANTTGTNITAAPYNPNTGVLALSGSDTVANYQKVLRTVTYNNSSQVFGNLLPSVDVVVSDGTNSSPLAFSEITLVEVNNAPILNTSFGFFMAVPLDPNRLTGISEDVREDDFSVFGNTSDEIVYSAFDQGNQAAIAAYTDPDDPSGDSLPGIAVVAVDNTNGKWQFTDDFGATWQDVGNVSESNALLIANNIESGIRFVPNPDFHGIVTNGISFRAWDQSGASPQVVTRGRTGRRADTTNNGGITPYSTAIGTASITVRPMPDLFVDSKGLFENFYGGSEKWLRGDAGHNRFGNTWYYILPNGDIFAWDGSNGLSGDKLNSFGPNGWENPELLINAVTRQAANPAELQTADAARGFYRSSRDNFFFSALGGGEKWIKGEILKKTPANQGNPWYYILPSGSVHEWDGSNDPNLNRNRVTSITPDANVYKDPSLLYNAFQDATVNSAGWDALRHFEFDSNPNSVHDLWENWSGDKDEKWFRGVAHDSGFPRNDWYFLLPNGQLFEWDGQRSATGTKIADLNPNAWDNIERVVKDSQPATNLAALDQQHSLFRASRDRDFFFDFFGKQEKWLRGKPHSGNNDWYIVTAQGTLLAWDGSSDATGNELAKNLASSVYDNPLALADAYADGSVLDNILPLDPFNPNNGGPGDTLN